MFRVKKTYWNNLRFVIMVHLVRGRFECVFINFTMLWKLKLQVQTHGHMHEHASMKQQKCVPCNHCSRKYTRSYTVLLLVSVCLTEVQFPFAFIIFCLFFLTKHALSINWHIHRPYGSVISAQPALPHTCACISAYVCFLIKRPVVVRSQMLLTDPLISRSITHTYIHSRASPIGRLHDSYF